MTTFKDLQDRIALDYLNRMTLVPEVKRAIVNAVRSVEANRYWFNQASTAIAAVASQSYVTVPTDFMSLDRLEITVSNNDYPLREQPFNAIRAMNVARTQGQPTDFTYHANRFELAIIPASAYPITVYYLKTLPTLSADTDSNEWTNEAGNLIAHMATIDLLSGVLQADERIIARHTRALALAENELNSRNSIRLTTRLTPTHF